MKIISSPVQTRHDPQQIMLRGRMIKPVEQPKRLRILAQSLAEDGTRPSNPAPMHSIPSAGFTIRSMSIFSARLMPSGRNFPMPASRSCRIRTTIAARRRRANRPGAYHNRSPEKPAGTSATSIAPSAKGHGRRLRRPHAAPFMQPSLLRLVRAAPSQLVARPGITPIEIRPRAFATSITPPWWPTCWLPASGASR